MVSTTFGNYYPPFLTELQFRVTNPIKCTTVQHINPVMTPFLRTSSYTLALAALSSTLVLSPVIAEPNSAKIGQIQQEAGIHLTEELLRVSRTVFQSEPLTVEGIRVGVALVELAAELDPANPTVWRAWIETAKIADNVEMRRRGVKTLLQLLPSETPLQLARLRDAIDNLNTAPQRIALYEQLLAPSSSNQLHASVAARLAFDAAMLQRQLGNTQQFARWLAESVALDPYFTDGVAVAVGFFGDDSADAYRRVELLTTLMLSNMRDITSQVSLAELLMSFGAYKAASRMFDIALADNANDPAAISNNLFADMVMSHWAARDVEGALALIAKRQRNADDLFRGSIQKEQPRATPLELARIHAPLAPKLATVKAAIYTEGGKEKALWALNRAIESINVMISLYEGQVESVISGAGIAELCLNAAWINVWLGVDPQVTIDFMSKAESLIEISQLDKNNLEGWVALRSGDLNKAEKYFLQNTVTSDPIVAGLATLRLEQGRTREAAALFFQLARESAGTLLGIWSRSQLEKLLGQQIVARPESEDLEKLIDGIPKVIDQYTSDASITFRIRVKPVVLSVGPYQPILVTIELTNNGVLPMQISQQGPIQPIVLLEVVTQIANANVSSRIPIIIDVDRKLILKPRERFSITVDLRNYWVGMAMNQWPTRGGFLQMHAVSNFSVRTAQTIQGTTTLVYEPSILGSRSKQVQMRVEGVRLTDLWLEKAIDQVKKMETFGDLISFALLTWAVGDDVDIQVVEPLIPPPPGEEAPLVLEGERHPLQDEATNAILMTFPSLDSTSKAWILSVMSSDPSFDSLITMADAGGNDLTTIGWMLRFVSPTVEDTVLDNTHLLAAMADESPRVRLIANWIYQWVETQVEVRKESELGSFDDESVSP